MKVQIKKFSTHKTAKILTVIITLLFTCYSLLFVPIVILSMGPEPSLASVVIELAYLLFIGPAIWFVINYLLIRLFLWIYNKVSSRLGGFEFKYESCD